MYSHRVSAAVMDSMNTDSIMSALKVIMMEHGYQTRHLSFDAGSSLIPAAERTAEAVNAAHDEEEEEEEVRDDSELDPATAAAVVSDLKRAGFKLRQTYSKASYKQSNIESSVKSVKKILKASFLPGMAGMTVTSFTRVVQLAISTVNLRPVILLPYDAAKPGELTVLSPQALRGPDHAQYVAVARARHFTGQAAIVAQQQQSFAKKWQIFYTARLRRTHSMAQNELEGGGFKKGDVCLIMDLSSSQGQSPFPQLGIIHAFLGPGQAVLHYGFKEGHFKSVNRPLSKLSKLVYANEQIPPEGLLFDPLIQDDFLQEEEAERLDDDGGEIDDEEGDHRDDRDDGAVQDDGEEMEREAEDHGEARQGQGQGQGQAEEESQHGDGGPMARDAMGNGAGDHGHEHPAGIGQCGDIRRDGGTRANGAKGQGGQTEEVRGGTKQHGVANEPVRGTRNRVITVHFWNR